MLSGFALVINLRKQDVVLGDENLTTAMEIPLSIHNINRCKWMGNSST
jgi:hypothetical protein